MTQSQERWQASWAGNVAENLRAIRRERGFKSARELSEACAAVGFPIPRNAIANIESGRKAVVPFHEVLVLARALGVPPIRLLLNVSGGDVEVVPGFTTHPWAAIRWISGEAPLRATYEYGPGAEQGLAEADREAFEVGAAPIMWHRVHDQMVGSIIADQHGALTMLRWAAQEPEGSALRAGNLKLAWDRWQRLFHQQDDLRMWRGRMVEAGVPPLDVKPEVLGREPTNEEWAHRTELERERFDAVLDAMVPAESNRASGEGRTDG